MFPDKIRNPILFSWEKEKDLGKGERPSAPLSFFLGAQLGVGGLRELSASKLAWRVREEGTTLNRFRRISHFVIEASSSFLK